MIFYKNNVILIAEITKEQAEELAALVHQLQPNCLINNRLGAGLPGDYETPEQSIPNKPERLFEVCMTLNPFTWGYKKNATNWKSPTVVIHQLVDIASKGGNYLLNVGPTAEGIIPPASVRILGEVGKWMEVNGESIYGTTASPLGKLSWGRCAAKPGKLYLHVFDWPEDDKLELPCLRNKVEKAYLLADSDKRQLKFTRINDEDRLINIPAKALDPIDTVVVLEIKA